MRLFGGPLDRKLREVPRSNLEQMEPITFAVVREYEGAGGDTIHAHTHGDRAMYRPESFFTSLPGTPPNEADAVAIALVHAGADPADYEAQIWVGNTTITRLGVIKIFDPDPEVESPAFTPNE